MYHLTHSVRFLCIKCRKCHGKINWCHQMGMGRWLKLSPEHFSIQNDRIQKKLRSKCDNDAKLMIFQFPHDWIQRKVQKTCFPPLKAYWLPSSIHVSRLWKAVPRLGAALNWSNRNGHNGRLKNLSYGNYGRNQVSRDHGSIVCGCISKRSQRTSLFLEFQRKVFRIAGVNIGHVDNA